MTHTFKASSGTEFTYNETFTGNVEILEPFNDTVVVEIQDLLEFVGEYVKFQRSENVEAMAALGLDKS